MIILGIESSCDETGAAVINASGKEHFPILLSNILATSLPLHAATGGIIPENAAREQVKFILPVIQEALQKGLDYSMGMTPPPIDAIAVTYGPGLIGSLLVGVETAKTLALLWNKPIIPVNHLYGHIYANWLIADSTWQTANTGGESSKSSATSNMPYAAIAFPAIALVVSGGHTDLVLMKNHGDLQVIGGTRDDAAGEAFDKIGRLLNLPYPAGPTISKLAKQGNAKRFVLPRPMIGSGDFDFSFSGLKTAVLNLVKKNKWDFHNSEFRIMNSELLNDLCAAVETTIVDVLVKKTITAAKEYNVKSILLGGGVAANEKLRTEMERFAQSAMPNAKFFAPAKNLSTDNAAMIATAAYYNYHETPLHEITADPELYF